MLCWCLKKNLFCFVLWNALWPFCQYLVLASHPMNSIFIFFFFFKCFYSACEACLVDYYLLQTPLTLLFMCPPLQSITVFKLLLDFHSFPLTWVASCLNAQRIAAHFLHDNLQVKESAHIYTCCVNAVCHISWLKYHWHRIDLDIRALCNIISSPVTMVISTNIVGMFEDSHRSYLCLNDWITSTD